jgi:hypothetical protein
MCCRESPGYLEGEVLVTDEEAFRYLETIRAMIRYGFLSLGYEVNWVDV